MKISIENTTLEIDFGELTASISVNNKSVAFPIGRAAASKLILMLAGSVIELEDNKPIEVPGSKSLFAEKLLHYRKLAGFTNKSLSIATGIAASTIKRYESGLYPTIHGFERLCKVLPELSEFRPVNMKGYLPRHISPPKKSPKRKHTPTKIGSLIRSEREKAGISSRKLSAMIGQYSSYISKIETGYSGMVITPKIADKIRKVLPNIPKV